MGTYAKKHPDRNVYEKAAFRLQKYSTRVICVDKTFSVKVACMATWNMVRSLGIVCAVMGLSKLRAIKSHRINSLHRIQVPIIY